MNDDVNSGQSQFLPLPDCFSFNSSSSACLFFLFPLPMSHIKTANHLIVMQHGFHGTPWDLAIIEETLQKLFTQGQVRVVCPNLNTEWFQTHEGIQKGGQALYQAVLSTAAELGWVHTRQHLSCCCALNIFPCCHFSG